ncbi:GTP cyclohydrolase, FolE2/MptA family [Thermogladius sp. 4427co]|uniref:GTP cyclohydrolase, FolE2/MptA family n=1 Tax=Thermogladius sp. 4427co TaxID=3450718 RepID=UPI003F7991C4
MSIRDIHDEKPVYEIDIWRVGIGWIKLPPRSILKYYLNPEIKAYVNLPKDKRGVHLSRTFQSILEALDYEPFELPLRLSRMLLEKHEYSTLAGVILRAEGLAVENDNLRKFGFLNHVELNRRGEIVFEKITIRLAISIACPCALDTSLALFNQPYTHTQRALINVKVLNKGGINIDKIVLLEKVLEITQPELKGLLKRVEEAEFIRKLYEKPMFAEDVVREIAFKLSKSLDGLGGFLEVKTVSLESIHEYNVESVVRVKL